MQICCNIACTHVVIHWRKTNAVGTSNLQLQLGTICGHQHALPQEYTVKHRKDFPDRVVPSMAIEKIGSGTDLNQVWQQATYLDKDFQSQVLPVVSATPVAMPNFCIMCRRCLPEWLPSPPAADMATPSLNLSGKCLALCGPWCTGVTKGFWSMDSIQSPKSSIIPSQSNICFNNCLAFTWPT